MTGELEAVLVAKPCTPSAEGVPNLAMVETVDSIKVGL